MQDGKVEAVGADLELPFPCEEVDARDAVAMPGLIHPLSRLGLIEYNRSGSRADLRVADEFLAVPEAYQTALEEGFTTLVLQPGGNTGIPGRSLAIRTADVGSGFVLQEDVYVKIQHRAAQSDKRNLKQSFENAKKEIEKVEKAREEWEKKKKEAEEAAKKAEKPGEPKPETPPTPEDKPRPEDRPKDREARESGAAEDPPKPPPAESAPAAPKVEEFKPPPIKPELEPLVAMIQKQAGALGLIEIAGASTYLHLRDALEKFDVPYSLASNTRAGGGFGSVIDLFFVAKELGERKERVLVHPSIVTYPYSSDRVNLPRRLVEAGAVVGFAPFSDDDDQLRSLRFQVGEVISGGLSRADALKAMTLHVAEALGMGARLGSLEKGKDANLVLFTGDPFDVQTRVERVLIEGVVAYDRRKAH